MGDIFRIVVSPDVHKITPGARITYYCEEDRSKRMMEESSRAREYTQWFRHADRGDAKANDLSHIEKGPIGWKWMPDWTRTGKFTIQSLTTTWDKKKNWNQVEQVVGTVDSALSEEMTKAKGTKTPTPGAQLAFLERYVKVLKAGAERFPIKDSGKKLEHEKRVKQLELYIKKLGEKLTSSHNKQRIPVEAVHLAVENQKRSELRVFVSCIRAVGGIETWHLVDWTNPTVRETTGLYEGMGTTPSETISEAIKKWNGKNRYPRGTLRYEIPSEGIKGEFETDGKSLGDRAADFFGWVALGAGIVAGVVTLVAPVPGSRVVSGLIWTGIFSGTASAAINIGQRVEEGFSNWKEDGMDALGIVGSIFTAGWLRGASILAKTGKAGKVGKFCLVGQVGTDGVQGVLIAADSIQKYDEIVNDPNLTPEERTRKLADFFKGLASGALLIVGLKSTTKDLKNLGEGSPGAKNLARLKDPGETIDLTTNPRVKGKTKDGKVKTETQDEQLRPRPAANQPKRKYTRAGKPSTRGMRKRDHQVFKNMAKEKDLIILVRDSNPAALEYVGKKGYRAKPMELKAKTRKENPNKGLAAADPDSQATKDLLKADGITYDQYVRKLEQEGYTVGSAKDGYVVRNRAGEAFYSDYDLHGVYKRKTGADAYTDALADEMNLKFGGKLVQHGPHDNWGERLNKGPNRGPQPPVTAYMPDGRTILLGSKAQMKQFYEAHGIDWKRIYPDD